MFWLLATFVYLLEWLWLFDLNRVELVWCGVAAAIAMAATIRHWRFGAGNRPWKWLAQRPTASLLAVGLGALGMRAALLPVIPIPIPIVTDEFSHLLLADTLLAGRFANPTHPMWRHFETIHEIQRPTYASMYFPAQGAVLALGKLVFGHAWWGVWLSNGAMCAALCWMLRQWLPPAWALFGGLIAILRFSAFSYWNDSYWGGAVPATGGALVMGAAGAMRKRPTLGNGALFGAGAAVLLLSRPYEGAVLCAAAGVYCRRQAFSRSAAVAVAIVALAAVGLSGYCRQVTGSFARLPYQVNQTTYGWPMTLLWLPTHPPPQNLPKQLRDYYDWERSQHDRFFGDSTVEKSQFLWGFFLGPCLTVPLFLLRNDRRTRPFLFMGGAVLLAVGVEQTGYPHYFSPATGAVLALVTQGARHLRQARFGRSLVPMIPVVLILTLAVRAIAGPIGLQYTSMMKVLSWCCQVPQSKARADLERRLEATRGKHLVIVHYGEKHVFAREWVYNAANIDGAKVVWARDLGSDANDEVKRYFADRQVWEVVADQ